MNDGLAYYNRALALAAMAEMAFRPEGSSAELLDAAIEDSITACEIDREYC